MVPEGESTVFAVDYRDRDLAARVVREMAASIDMLVDTNYGEVVRGSRLTEDHLVPQ